MVDAALMWRRRCWHQVDLSYVLPRNRKRDHETRYPGKRDPGNRDPCNPGKSLNRGNRELRKIGLPPGNLDRARIVPPGRPKSVVN
jgi:hypothetical protein